jgi:hypothetical protein
LSVAYTYDIVATTNWTNVPTPPSSNPTFTSSISLVYNGNYFIISGSTGTTSYFCNSTDGLIWGSWVSGPAQLTKQFIVNTKNSIPYINIIPPGPIGPTGATGSLNSIIQVNGGSITQTVTLVESTNKYIPSSIYGPYSSTATTNYLLTLNLQYVSIGGNTRFTIARGSSNSILAANCFNILTGTSMATLMTNSYLCVGSTSTSTNTSLSTTIIDTPGNGTVYYSVWIYSDISTPPALEVKAIFGIIKLSS